MNDQEMKSELAAVLADPRFSKSPVLARVLIYLVDATLLGEGKNLKSYSVAVEGLGRSPDFDAKSDTYPRVQVARLRQALEAYYASSGVNNPWRLVIERGSYEVSLVPHGGQSLQEAASIQPPRRLRRWRRSRAYAVLAGLLVAVVIMISVQQWLARQAAAERWGQIDMPTIHIRLDDNNESSENNELMEDIKDTLIMKIGKYEGIRQVDANDKMPNYTLHMQEFSGKNYNHHFYVVNNQNKIIIWSDYVKIDRYSKSMDSHYDDEISRITFLLTNATGLIHSYERRIGHRQPDTPYGCYLRFTEVIQGSVNFANDELQECSRSWYAAMPRHHLAAAIYGWTSIDRSMFVFNESRRKQDISDAITVLETARSLNPRSGLLQVSLIRAYAMAGDGAALRAAADRAMLLNPENIDLLGAVGMYLTLYNDPRGEPLLKRAIARHFNPPPWYYLGLFIGSMMREDTVGTSQALTQIRSLNHSLPVLPVLSAAHQARTGQLAQARASWEQAKKSQPAIRIDPDLLFNRFPISAQVRLRLKQWLKPVLA